VITDGRDNASQETLQEATRRLQQQDWADALRDRAAGGRNFRQSG
jgi:hypothetical protein